jgi:hypothetical protein
MRKWLTISEFKFLKFTLEWPSDRNEDEFLKLVIAFHRIYIQIPIKFIKVKIHESWDSSGPRYGFAYHGQVFWIYTGAGDKWITFDMPWMYTIVRHDLLLPNGELYHRNHFPKYKLGKRKRSLYWHDVVEQNDKNKPVSGEQVEYAKFVEIEHYTKRGKYQKARIRLLGEEREWRMRWFTWLPLFRMIQRTVDCESDVELGERAGSWKGGRMGWSCEWRKDETMIHAFHRWYKNWNGD